MTKADQFREYAEEALQWSRQSKTEDARNVLIDLALPRNKYIGKRFGAGRPRYVAEHFINTSAILLLFGTIFASGVIASAQQDSRPSKMEYLTVAAALDAVRAKSGVSVKVESGWTVIEDPATMSIWSFTSSGHPAHPAAVRRAVTQQGDKIFVDMSVLCEAAKSACDKLVAEFNALNRNLRAEFR
jgi:hypothetical protein